ncbi:hypothetical protein FJV76_14300 [Mesorhizobium sp. WSM4303]|uniref:hypothetical protein n=1 Tax=Mesorhizobium sp. WSM4303 TaxID=2589887 RepID=UPI00115DB0C3|nr:hypothetical protein [Mesorhizobium sp. WSM4303]TRD03805.1 hypothetical protein FJV76_14300 [Mesorhizobium sp. WSM4303]
MSVELQSTTPIEGVAIPDAAVIDHDAELGAVWDKLERDNGAERENGKFVSPDPEKRTESAAPPPAAEEEEAGKAVSTPDEPAPLPPVPGLEEVWEAIPAEAKAKLAAKVAEDSGRITDLSRQVGSFKQINEVVRKHKDLYENRKMPDGSPVTATTAMDFLFNAQRKLDQHPASGIIDIIDNYGPEVRAELAAILTGQKTVQRPSQPATPPVDVEALVEQKLQSFLEAQKGEEEIGRLSKDKPLFSEIDPDDMVHHINTAWKKLGQAASKEAVFNEAYDRAVNADPVLRAKAAAAKAPVAKPQTTEAAKRANSVNLTSTSSGKTRALTEDELLAAAWDKSQGH